MIETTVHHEPRPPLTDGHLRQFAALCLLVFGGLGLLNLYLAGPTVKGAVLLTLGAWGLCGLARPALVRPLYRVMMAVAYPIGLVVSNLLLAAIYLALFTPLALLFRLIGRDVLGRARPVGAATYWKECPAGGSVRRYLRQY